MHHDGDFDTVLVVDFGAQYAQLIARRVRECQVYSEIVPAPCPPRRSWRSDPRRSSCPAGPRRSTRRARRQSARPPDLLSAGVPVLGICYGFQLMVSGLGGVVAHTGAGEYGATALELISPSAPAAGRAAGRSGAAGRRSARRAARAPVGVDVAR